LLEGIIKLELAATQVQLRSTPYYYGLILLNVVAIDLLLGRVIFWYSSLGIVNALKRIALVYPFYPPFIGGIETRMYNLAEALSKRDIDVHIITNSLNNKTKQIYSKGIYLHRFVLPSSFEWPYSSSWPIKAAPVIADTIKKFDIQLIDAQDCTGLMASFLAKALVPSLRIVFTLHDTSISYRRKYSISQVSFFINCLKWNAMIVPSNFVKKQVNSLARRRLPIFRVYNGINIRRFASNKRNQMIRKRLGISINDKVLLNPTRASPEKGILFVIRALKKVSQTHNVKLIVSGNGSATSEAAASYYNKLISEVNALRLNDNVIFCNGSFKYEEMPSLYSSSDIVILASIISEGFGNALVESMAAGTPVIGTRIGAIPEIIKNRRNGILVKPRSSKMISDSVSVLLDDQDLYEKLKRNGKLDALRLFSSDRMANHLLAIYRKTMS
jgi:glycosyltransferase involved in cell wall biosynthesis